MKQVSAEFYPMLKYYNGGDGVMMYLNSFSLLSREDEEGFSLANRRANLTCYNTRYPFGVFRYRELPTFKFEPITIFYGGNGSGKSTVLNVIAEKLSLKRGAVYNRSDFFEDYVQRCKYETTPGKTIPDGSMIITSDDVFDYLLDVRCINSGIDTERAAMLSKYVTDRKTPYQLKSLDDYDEWKRRDDAKTKTKSRFLRDRLMSNVREKSNGETALDYFSESIKENALYLLDEPENSLSASFQLELKRFLEDSVRFFGCQFIISTHSPFILSTRGAKIYDLSAEPPRERLWTELESVRIYYDFITQNSSEFSKAES